MKLKKIILILLLLFLCSCSKEEYDTTKIDYNLNIDKAIIEDITFYISKETYDTAEETLDDNNPSLAYILKTENINSLTNNNEEYYTKEIIEKDDIYIIKLEYIYSINEFIYSKFINTCFESYTLSNENNEINISLNDNFYCSHDKDISINIETDYNVYDTTLPIINDKYHYTITKDNKDKVNFLLNIKR